MLKNFDLDNERADEPILRANPSFTKLDIRSDITRRVEVIYALASQFWPQATLPLPTIDFDLRGVIAGKAFYSSYRLQFNAPLAADNRDEFLDQTVPHECAHLIARTLYGSIAPHGKEWKYVMVQLGARPARCHSYDVETHRRSTRHIYHCACQEHALSTRLHNQIQAGQRRHCLRCNQTVQPGPRK
jgi:SprT protein